jgi:hypothetical protein
MTEELSEEDKLLAVLGKTQDDFGRFRCVGIEDNKICVRARIGGGNREAYRHVFMEMQKHPLYVYDEDDDFDCTYAYLYFNTEDRRAPDPRLPWLTCECGDTFTEDALCADCARTEREGLRYNLEKMAEALRVAVTGLNILVQDLDEHSVHRYALSHCRAVIADYDAEKGGGE